MRFFRIMLIAGLCLYGIDVQARQNEGGQERSSFSKLKNVSAKKTINADHSQNEEITPVHRVPFGSSGNRIELAILTGSMPVANIQVKSINPPTWIRIDPAEQVVANVQPNKAGTVTFIFSVENSAPLNKEQELTFLISTDGGEQRKIIRIVIDLPQKFELFQNYPNPFNPATVIGYTLPEDSRVSIKVYDVLGREVKTLADEVQEAGYNNVTFDAADLASGVYFIRFTANAASPGRTGQFSDIKKVLLLR